MARQKLAWSVPHDVGDHVSAASRQTFAQRLRSLMREKDLRPSDVARALWGDRTDKRGYVAARGRDRIGKYLAGHMIPDGETLKQLCDFLQVSEAFLAPSVVGERMEANYPEVRITIVKGHNHLGHLTLNVTIPVEHIMKCMAIVREGQDLMAAGKTGKLEMREPDPPDDPPEPPEPPDDLAGHPIVHGEHTPEDVLAAKAALDGPPLPYPALPVRANHE